jgi:hypothetical protein
MRPRWLIRAIAVSTKITVLGIFIHFDLGANDRIDLFVIGPTGLPGQEPRKIGETL